MKDLIFKMKGKILLVMISLLSVVALSGCFERQATITIDPTKTQLYVGVYDGDLGTQWIFEEVAAKYVELNPDIQIIPIKEKDLYGDTFLLENMKSENTDIYLLNGNTYSNYIARGLISDITTEVTTPLDEYENTGKSIEDKMSTALQKHYEVDGKYYAVPFFDSVFGTVYDADLFENEGFYFNTDGDLLCDSSNSTLSAGPNGVTGDYDDGLPATYSEWKELVDTIYDTGYTPYIWTGQYYLYRQRFITSVWADYEGKTNFDLNMSLNGSYTFAGESTPTQITVENGYLLKEKGQKGQEYALQMAEYIIRKGYYTSDSFDSYNTHTLAQETFLYSTRKKPIAMIFEGGWWENGARGVFETMVEDFGQEYAYGTRNFGFMPAPKADDGSSDPGTTLISSTGNSFICINKNSDVLEIAKDFLRFLHTDESLRTFTRVTGAVRPYDYELTKEDRAAMTNFGRTMFDIYHDPNTQISYTNLYEDEVFLKEPDFFSYANWSWGATLDGIPTTDPMYEFTQSKTLTVQQYLAGMKERYSKSAWDKQLKNKYY